jgi:hypothetical protein
MPGRIFNFHFFIHDNNICWVSSPFADYIAPRGNNDSELNKLLLNSIITPARRGEMQIY